MSQPERFEVLILGSGQGGKLLVGIWRDRGDGPPSLSAGGSGAPVPTSPACPARMRFGARGSHIWRITPRSSARRPVPSRPTSGRSLGGQLKRELSDEELLEFVGRGISAKDKPTSVSGWEVDVEHLDRRELFQNRSRREPGSSEAQFVTQSCVEAKSQERNKN